MEPHVVIMNGLKDPERREFINWYNKLFNSKFTGYSDRYRVPYVPNKSTGIRVCRWFPNIKCISFSEWKSLILTPKIVQNYEIY